LCARRAGRDARATGCPIFDAAWAMKFRISLRSGHVISVIWIFMLLASLTAAPLGIALADDGERTPGTPARVNLADEFSQGLTAMAKGNLAPAAEHFEHVVAQDPASFEAH